MHIERRKISLLADEITGKFEENVNELVDVSMANQLVHFMDGFLRVCFDVCWK